MLGFGCFAHGSSARTYAVRPFGLDCELEVDLQIEDRIIKLDQVIDMATLAHAPSATLLGQNLALCYQECITAVVRVQAGSVRNVDSVVFRQAAQRSLQDAERSAGALNYLPATIQKASLAVVALLDEVALASDVLARAEWSRMPLALELYQEPRAGEAVFNQIEECLRVSSNSPESADLLEVYLLVLLLGFEGRHAGKRAELHELAERARSRIEMIRPRTNRLTPEADVASVVPVVRLPQSGPNRLLIAAAAFVGGAIVLFLLLKVHLWWAASRVGQMFPGR